MLFYSTVAIIVGVLLGGTGLLYLIKKDEGLNKLKKNKLKNPRLYTNIISWIMILVGICLIVSGILSFIFSHDLMFSIIFSVLIVVYLLVDFLLQIIFKN